MNNIARPTLLAVLSLTSLARLQPQSSDAAAPAPVFRDPFTLKLQTGNKHHYEEHFDKIPYVADNSVYLFAGENFGINVLITGDEIKGVTYQKDAQNADVEFKFTQEKAGGRMMMILVIRSKLKRQLLFDALMMVPGDNALHKTSILPRPPELPNLLHLETWPHPIVQLVLNNFRFSEEASK